MMTRDKILRLVTDALQETTGAARERVTPSARIIEDIGADSLDIVELVRPRTTDPRRGYAAPLVSGTAYPRFTAPPTKRDPP